MTDQSRDSDANDRGFGSIIWASCGALILASVVLAGLFAVRAPGFGSVQTASPVAANAAEVQMTIVTNGGPQHDSPAFTPATFAIPANQAVTISVTNLDGATPLPSSLQSYAKVKGVVGQSMAVTPIRISHPKVAKGQTRRLDELNASVVSHTFSIPALGINVPITGASRTTFTIQVAKPGTYSWECFDPCGSGPSGFGPPMGVVGYMAGTVTVTSA